jgi:hypothetical protein
MNNGLTVSFNYIVEKVYRDTGFESIAHEDEMKEWMFEAMRLIGARGAWKLVVTDGDETNKAPDPIEIEDYRGKLPKNMKVKYL